MVRVAEARGRRTRGEGSSQQAIQPRLPSRLTSLNDPCERSVPARGSVSSASTRVAGAFFSERDPPPVPCAAFDRPRESELTFREQVPLHVLDDAACDALLQRLAGVRVDVGRVRVRLHEDQMLVDDPHERR